MPDGTRLKALFERMIRVLGGSAEEVFIRTYEETGGHPESGMPPARIATDVPISPRPIVLAADQQFYVFKTREIESVRIEAGDVKIVMDADEGVEAETILHFRGADWRVYRVDAPVLFGSVQVKIAYARKVQG
ncbi:MAG: hypothetical protein HRF49_01415 [bacterium]|jgi:hypothetical protein